MRHVLMGVLELTDLKQDIKCDLQQRRQNAQVLINVGYRFTLTGSS